MKAVWKLVSVVLSCQDNLIQYLDLERRATTYIYKILSRRYYIMQALNRSFWEVSIALGWMFNVDLFEKQQYNEKILKLAWLRRKTKSSVQDIIFFSAYNLFSYNRYLSLRYILLSFNDSKADFQRSLFDPMFDA